MIFSKISNIKTEDLKNMAKYKIKFACGHTELKELLGKEKDRQNKIKWYEENGICSDCYKTQKEKELLQFEEEKHLPQLQGTEKQIKWARKIRFNNFSNLSGIVKESFHIVAKELQLKEVTKEQKEQIKKLIENAKTNNSAKFWIEEIEENGLYKQIKNIFK